MEFFTNDREFSDVQIFQHSGKGIPLFMAGHKNCLQSEYLLEIIYRAAVSLRLINTALIISRGQFVSISFRLNICSSYFEAVKVLQGDRLNYNEYNFRSWGSVVVKALRC
jgi:hypothetical protein